MHCSKLSDSILAARSRCTNTVILCECYYSVSYCYHALIRESSIVFKRNGTALESLLDCRVVQQANRDSHKMDGRLQANSRWLWWPLKVLHLGIRQFVPLEKTSCGSLDDFRLANHCRSDCGVQVRQSPNEESTSNFRSTRVQALSMCMKSILLHSAHLSRVSSVFFLGPPPLPLYLYLTLSSPTKAIDFILQVAQTCAHLCPLAIDQQWLLKPSPTRPLA
jgi:hypothetical protein